MILGRGDLEGSRVGAGDGWSRGEACTTLGGQHWTSRVLYAPSCGNDISWTHVLAYEAGNLHI